MCKEDYFFLRLLGRWVNALAETFLTSLRVSGKPRSPRDAIDPTDLPVRSFLAIGSNSQFIFRPF